MRNSAAPFSIQQMLTALVDHTELLEALRWVQENIEWPLGDLLDGHEFFIVELKHRARPTPQYGPAS